MDRIVKFLAFPFLAIFMTFIFFLLFYGIYIKYNPLINFLQIKSGLENTANLSIIERGLIENRTITSSIIDKSIQSHIFNITTNYIIAFVISGLIIIIYYTKNSGGNQRVAQCSPIIPFPGKRIEFYKDSNNMIMTLDGILISIVGGFTVSSGSKNLIIIGGFEVLIMSIIYSYLAHISLTSAVQEEENLVNKESLLNFFSRSNYSFWYLIMGLSLIIGGIFENVL